MLMDFQIARRSKLLACSDSTAYCLPDLANVPRWRHAALPAIFAAELRSAFIAHRERRIRRAVIASQQHLSRRLQAKLFCVLQRAQAGDRREVPMKAVATHATDLAKHVDTQLGVLVISNP